jgi:hypothetical protein
MSLKIKTIKHNEGMDGTVVTSVICMFYNPADLCANVASKIPSPNRIRSFTTVHTCY